MCLAIPGKIKSIKDNIAVVDFSGLKREVGLHLIPDAKVGGYVLVHAGFAIQTLDKKEAKIRLKLFKEMEGIG